ncbi:response regulator [Ramlibacter albus]|uniref:Response regulator transcription factor n=1 Tax=Ramlibacter albus TaxID=2079448 RepID=A0A923MAE8_9BURK|nr:response regulator transcription factor [Ramlibacter albus]MBC5765866.1 response regulator transcription factor [Ramlibacter albus]
MTNSGITLQQRETPEQEPAAGLYGTAARWRKRGLGEPIRVGIVDDHPIVREALRSFLAEQEDIRVVAEADSGRTAIDLVRRFPLDVLILDLDMPGQSGIDAITLIKAKAEHLAVLIYSGHPENEYAVPLIRNGASGYLNKSCEPKLLLDAIRKLALGGTFITAGVADLLASQLMPARGPCPHEQLTARELQVFLKLARGRTPGDIARELCLSSKTISSYRAKVLEKLQARSNSDLTYYALKHRLLE